MDRSSTDEDRRVAVGGGTTSAAGGGGRAAATNHNHDDDNLHLGGLLHQHSTLHQNTAQHVSTHDVHHLLQRSGSAPTRRMATTTAGAETTITATAAIVSFLRKEADVAEKKAKSLRKQADELAAMFGISEESQRRYGTYAVVVARSRSRSVFRSCWDS